jgi:hypothetical protein
MIEKCILIEIVRFVCFVLYVVADDGKWCIETTTDIWFAIN